MHAQLTKFHADGKTYDPELDGPRLAKQLEQVKFYLSSGEWWTIGALQGLIGGSEAGISARIRDCRKAKFGGYIVQRKRFQRGLWMYRILPQSLAELTNVS
jgi:hypothetical protein